MLLTLSTRSFATLLKSADGRDALAVRGSARRPAKQASGTASPSAPPLSVLDLPDYAVRKLKLRGLSVLASMLAGWSLEDLDRLRDRADKAGCPCLVLVDDAPLLLSSSNASAGDGGRVPTRASRADDDAPTGTFARRVHRLATAAHRLGCNALSVRVAADDTDEDFEGLVSELRDMMPIVEHFELYLLLAPNEGLTHSPDRLVDVIKRVGGFRVGCLASFAHAADSPGGREPISALRVLAPYAGAIHATVRGFDRKGLHLGYDLAEYVAAIRSVGFSNTLAVEYVGDDEPGPNLEQACAILHEAIAAEPADGASTAGESAVSPVAGPES
jgi:hypothetical protein